MKIYIIGPSGSGKTTLSNALSKKYNVATYELDCIVYDDLHDHVKRSPEEIQKMFHDILKKDDWIIEDVGRDKFSLGLEKCDNIYYLKISKYRVYGRVIKRWIKQRLGLEKWNYPPTFYQFYDMLRVAKEYFKKENDKLEILSKYPDKIIYLSSKDLNKMIKDCKV